MLINLSVCCFLFVPRSNYASIIPNRTFLSGRCLRAFFLNLAPICSYQASVPNSPCPQQELEKVLKIIFFFFFNFNKRLLCLTPADQIKSNYQIFVQKLNQWNILAIPKPLKLLKGLILYLRQRMLLILFLLMEMPRPENKKPTANSNVNMPPKPSAVDDASTPSKVKLHVPQHGVNSAAESINIWLQL